MTAVRGATVPVPPLRRDVRIWAWVGATGLSGLGDTAWYVGLAWASVRVGGAHGGALTMGVGALPRALMLLAGGALADRWDTHRTMIAANLARIAVLIAGISVVSVHGTRLWMLATIAIAFGIFDALYGPAAATMPRQMVRTEDLTRVAAMFQLASRFAELAGAPTGGVLVAWGDIRAVMALDAASFLLIAVVLATLIRPRFARALSTGSSMLADLRAGIGYLRHRVDVRTLVIALSGLNLFVEPVIAVGLTLRTHNAGWGATSLGVFTACIGAGAAAGSVAAVRWRPVHPARTGLLLLIPQAIACALIGSADYPGVIAATVVIGITAGLASALLSGAFQATVDTDYLGRTSSILELGDQALMPVAMSLFGAIAAAGTVTLACAVAGTAFAIMVTWSATRLNKGIHEQDD